MKYVSEEVCWLDEDIFALGEANVSSVVLRSNGRTCCRSVTGKEKCIVTEFTCKEFSHY